MRRLRLLNVRIRPPRGYRTAHLAVIPTVSAFLNKCNHENYLLLRL